MPTSVEARAAAAMPPITPMTKFSVRIMIWTETAAPIPA